MDAPDTRPLLSIVAPVFNEIELIDEFYRRTRDVMDSLDDYDCELVVMGTICRTGLPGFFIGNTAETVLQSVDCAVLTVKPEGFVTPVTNVDGLPIQPRRALAS